VSEGYARKQCLATAHDCDYKMDNGNEVSLSRRRRASRPKVKTGCMNCKYVEVSVHAKTTGASANAPPSLGIEG